MEYTSLVLDFIVALVTSWPFITLVIVVFFHKEIGENITKAFDLLTRLKSFSAGDKSITFAEQLANIDEDKEETQQENDFEIKPEWGFTPQEEFEKLALLRPDFGILDSWRPVEKRLSRIGENESNNLTNKILPIGTILNNMVRKKMISKSHYHYIREISFLRNKVVHNNFGSITSEDAILYRKNCIEVMQILDSIPHNQETD